MICLPYKYQDKQMCSSNYTNLKICERAPCGKLLKSCCIQFLVHTVTYAQQPWKKNNLKGDAITIPHDPIDFFYKRILDRYNR
jgi:hypothetical protein